MKFQIGDRVLVVHSGEEGEVVEIINRKMVMVEVDGVRFPVYTDQLEFPYFKRFREASRAKSGPASAPGRIDADAIPREKHIPSKNREATGLWLSFLPVTHHDVFGDEVIDELKLHLVNETGADLHFEYRLQYQEGEGFVLKQTVLAFSNIYLHDIPFDRLNDGPLIRFTCSLVKPDKRKAKEFITAMKLRGKQVFSRIEAMREKGEASFRIRLMERYPDREQEPETDRGSLDLLARKGFRVYPASYARQHLEPPLHEVDLHIEKLVEDPSTLDSMEMLNIQLGHLEKYLDLAFAHHLPRMIVIHGVGSGKLRNEVHEILRIRPEVSSFVHRYHPAYGYGATEVRFK